MSKKIANLLFYFFILTLVSSFFALIIIFVLINQNKIHDDFIGIIAFTIGMSIFIYVNIVFLKHLYQIKKP